MADDRELIPLSRLSHAAYCLRRAALLSNEQLWQESADTAKGRAEHKRVHTERTERRGRELKLYEYTVFSHTLGIWGKSKLNSGTFPCEPSPPRGGVS